MVAARAMPAAKSPRNCLPPDRPRELCQFNLNRDPQDRASSHVHVSELVHPGTHSLRGIGVPAVGSCRLEPLRPVAHRITMRPIIFRNASQLSQLSASSANEAGSLPSPSANCQGRLTMPGFESIERGRTCLKRAEHRVDRRMVGFAPLSHGADDVGSEGNTTRHRGCLACVL